MDIHNNIHTRTTYNLLRLDHLALFVGMTAVMLPHLREVDWVRYAGSFLYPDLVGYIPAAICFYLLKRGAHRSIPKPFYVVYNLTHSLSFMIVVLAGWFLAHGGMEWAMLGMPMHFCIDRSVFGNFFKPFALSFEPRPHPKFSQIGAQLEKEMAW